VGGIDMGKKIDTVYCHFSFKRPKGADYGLFAVAFYFDKEGKKLTAKATRKIKLWENHQFVTAIQAYEHALYSIYAWQGIMKSQGIGKVMLVTDNSTLAGWIENPKKRKEYRQFMERAVERYRAGAPKELEVSIGLCDVQKYEKSYKYCKEEFVINDSKPAITKDKTGKKVIDIASSNMEYKTIREMELEDLDRPTITGI
jgi:hypothetical protein